MTTQEWDESLNEITEAEKRLALWLCTKDEFKTMPEEKDIMEVIQLLDKLRQRRSVILGIL